MYLALIRSRVLERYAAAWRAMLSNFLHFYIKVDLHVDRLEAVYMYC